MTKSISIILTSVLIVMFSSFSCEASEHVLPIEIRIIDVDDMKPIDAQVSIAANVNISKVERGPNNITRIWPSASDSDEIEMLIQVNAQAREYYDRTITMLLYGPLDRRGNVKSLTKATFYLAKKRDSRIPTLESVRAAANYGHTDPDRALVLLDRFDNWRGGHHSNRLKIALTFFLAETHFLNCVSRYINTCESSLNYFEKLEQLRHENQNRALFQELRLPQSNFSKQQLEEQQFKMDYRLAKWLAQKRNYQSALEQFQLVERNFKERCNDSNICMSKPISGITAKRLREDICAMKQQLGDVTFCN